jgi:hypothetical protein
VVPKPVSLTFEQAAAIPMAGATAMRGIRDMGAVRAGHRVLVNGVTGGVGTLPSRSRRRWARRSPGCAAPGHVAVDAGELSMAVRKPQLGR